MYVQFQQLLCFYASFRNKNFESSSLVEMQGSYSNSPYSELLSKAVSSYAFSI